MLLMEWLRDDSVKVSFLSTQHLEFELMRLFLASKFGAVLDMVTDRCTTACLLCYLSSAYPSYTFCFQGIISIDLASHYMHMYRYVDGLLSPHATLFKLCLIVVR